MTDASPRDATAPQPRAAADGSSAPRFRVPQRLDVRQILTWLYVGRLSLAAALYLAAVTTWRLTEPETTLSASLILVIAGVFTAGSFWHSHLRSARTGQNFAYAQVLFDTFLVAWVVHLTGGAESTFATIFVLVICAAAVLLPLAGGILIGALASVLYVGETVLLSSGRAEAAILLQVGLFTAVALVTGYIGDRLRQTGAALGQMETELHLLRLDTDDILGTIGSGILTLDRQERLIYANTAAEELLSLPAGATPGERVVPLLERAAPGLGEVIHRSFENRTGIRRFETGETGQGLILGVSTTFTSRSHDADATVTAIFQDITQRKRMDALRLRGERLEAVAELSASLAHEIKNPLASIRSAVEQLAGPAIDADDKKVLESLVIRESDRLSRLLAEFLDFSRVRTKELESLHLPALVRYAVEVVRSHPDGAGVSLAVHVPDGAFPSVRGDEDLLHRAILNVVLNAAQWAGAEGRVTVTLDTVEADILEPEVGLSPLVRLRVADSGPGVPAEQLEQIFHPFVTYRPGGTGLGLALVQRAVEAHGGAVFVEDSHGQTGATFTLYLPTERGPGARDDDPPTLEAA